MQFGFGLHPKWLGNGTREQFLTPFKAAGLTDLEFTLHPGTDEWESMGALAEECARAGYPCHFHAPYQLPFTLSGFASNQRDAIQKMYAPALELVERLAEENHLVPSLIIHGATANASRAELRRDTEAFLTWVLSATRHARLMLENLPPKPGFTRTGESREEVLDIVRQFHHPRLAICWDLGHDYLLGYTELPDADFLRAVKHVHIHDINAAREDHFPLVFGTVPWQADLRALASVGFDGAVIMEINGYRARVVERLYERMVESFAMMRDVIAS
ncbi:MAG: sugar phosphate isomerase/epimerase [Chloroflexi bacterium]|nr:sugar phosphate isomerase/epimerase [Chloroflexota bacterium]